METATNESGTRANISYNIGDKDLSCDMCLYDPLNDFRFWFNIGILIILVAGLTVLTYLIYRKYKGERGIREKFIAWYLAYFFIIFVLWLIVMYILWHIHLHQIG